MNFTKSSLIDSLYSSIIASLESISIHTDDDKDDVINKIQEIVSDNALDNYDVTYYHEAWDVVSGNEFNEYEDTSSVDFSSCSTALECVMAEASATIYNAVQSLSGEIINDLADEVMIIVDALLDEGYEGSVEIGTGSSHGWAVHDSEDGSGVCFYRNLESEQGLTALEYQLTPLHYGSACWNK